MAKDQVLVEFRLDTDAARDDANAIIKDGDRIVESYKKAADTISKDLTDALKLIASKSGEIIDVDAVVNDVEKLKKLLASLNDSAAGMSKGSKEYVALQQVIQGVSSQIEVLDKGIVKMGADAEKSAKSIRTQYKEAQQEVQRLSDKFGLASKEAATAAKKAAELKDVMEDSARLTEAYNPDAKFNALTRSISGAVAGVQAYEGAMVLMGLNSEDVMETLKRLNALMALSSGLQGLIEAKDSFIILKSVAVQSFAAIRTAIGLTGIGALAIAVGALVVYWDDIKEAITGVNKEMKELSNLAKKDLDIQNEKLKSLGDQDEVLKLQGRSELEILKIKQANLAQINRQKAADLKRILETELAEYESFKRRETQFTAAFGGDTTKISAELQKRRDNLNAITNETIKKLNESKNQEAAIQNDINAIYSKNAKERADNAEKSRLEREKEALEDAKRNTDRQVEFADAAVKRQDDKRKQLEKKSLDDRLNDLTVEYDAETQNIDSVFLYDKKTQDENTKYWEAKQKDKFSTEKDYQDQVRKLLEDQVKAVDDLAKRGLLLTIGIQPQSYDAMKSALQALDKDSGLSDPQKWAAFANAGQSVYSDISNFIRQKDKEDLQIELNNLNSQKEEELALAEGNEQKKAVILQKYKQKERELKRKDAEADKRKAIFDAIIGTAAAVVAAGIVTPQAILAGILGAAQVAFISAQPIPKFAKGVHRLQGRGTQTSDEIPAMLSKDESVVPAANSIKFSPLVESLVNGNPDDLIRKNYVLPALKAQEKQYQAALANKRDETIARAIAKAMSDTRANDNKNTERIVKVLNKVDILV